MGPTALRRARLLRPRLATDAVPRPRLITRLMAGLERPLTLVSAPAGYGKSTLLCQWLESVPARAAWLSLDFHDSDLASFAIALLAALRAVWPEAGDELLALLRLPVTPPPDYLGAAFVDALLDLPEPTVLVLDEYQAINDPRVHAFLTALLEHPAPNFHLAIATRVEPPLPLPLLRARDQVTELRGRDLAFTPAEAHAFLILTSEMDVSPEVAAQLEQQTEGWAAGLRLAALSLREEGGNEWLARGFTRRRQQHALDFLLDEVLTRLPAEMEVFLLRTSVVERVCGSLCEVLLDPPPLPGQGMTTLRQLVRSDLFVVALGEDAERREWVRYHPLFRELLCERLLEREGSAMVADLHRRAAVWLAEQGLIDEAIGALLAGREEDEAARLVEERVAAMTETVDWQELWGWLRLLPAALVQRRPGLLLAHAWVDNLRGRMASLMERLQAAMTLLDADGSLLSPEEAVRLRAQADDLTALICLYQGDSAGAVAAARRALPHFPDPHSFVAGVARMIVGLGLFQAGQHDEALRFLGETAGAERAPAPRAMFSLSLGYLTQGNHGAAQHWAALLLEETERHNLSTLRGWAHYLLGRVAYELNALEEARTQFAAVVAGYRTNFFCVSESMLGLALIEQALGDASRSDRLLAELDQLLAETGNDESRPRVNACQARLALQRGDYDEAIRWLGVGLADRTDILLFAVCPSLTEARALLARGGPGDTEAAAALLQAFRARAEREHATSWVIHAMAVQALVEQARGDGMAALDRLAAALDLAESGDFMRSFLDLGPPLVALLRGLTVRRPSSRYLARLLAASNDVLPIQPATRPHMADASLTLLGRLTEREAQVLELLAHHLTNKEIAAALSISPMTVKRHVSNILDKLDVGTRRQAILKATTLNLLPPISA